VHAWDAWRTEYYHASDTHCKWPEMFHKTARLHWTSVNTIQVERKTYLYRQQAAVWQTWNILSSDWSAIRVNWLDCESDSVGSRDSFGEFWQSPNCQLKALKSHQQHWRHHVKPNNSSTSSSFKLNILSRYAARWIKRCHSTAFVTLGMVFRCSTLSPRSSEYCMWSNFLE
jgi:hypothetical protein